MGEVTVGCALLAIDLCKIPSPKMISNGFCIVTVKVPNSYDWRDKAAQKWR